MSVVRRHSPLIALICSLNHSSGGDFYNNSRSRYSNSFARSVVQGAETGDVSYTYAFELFDGSMKTYDFFKEEIMSYGG